jgi:hypothetical protein
VNRSVWLPILMAAVCGWLFLASCRDDDSPSAVSTYVDTAEDWFAYFESGQVEKYQNLMATDAWWRCEGCKPEVREGPYFGGRQAADLTDTRDSLLLYAASGSITPLCKGEGHVVTCEIRLTDTFREQAGLDVSRYRYQFTFKESGISEVIFEPLPPHDRYQTGSQINAYSNWLRQNYPQQHHELFAHGTMIVEPFEKAGRHRELIGEWRSAN